MTFLSYELGASATLHGGAMISVNSAAIFAILEGSGQAPEGECRIYFGNTSVPIKTTREQVLADLREAK